MKQSTIDMTLYTDTLTLGKKGQITLPKKLRDFDKLEEDDTFTLTRLPSGEIVLRKKKEQSIDKFLETIQRLQPINADRAWKEIITERRTEELRSKR